MDKVFIEDLEVYACHGVHKGEKELGQMFIVSVEMDVPFEAAAKTDDLTKTIHYGNVCKDIEQAMVNVNYNLIEAVAYHLLKTIFERYELAQTIKITLKKPWAPIGKHLKYVAVQMERTREKMYGNE